MNATLSITQPLALWLGISPTAALNVLVFILFIWIFCLLIWVTYGSRQRVQLHKVNVRFHQLNDAFYQQPKRALSDYLTWLPVTDKDRQELGRLLFQAGYRRPDAIFFLVALKLLGLIALPLFIWLNHDGALTLGLLFKLTIAALFASMAPEWWLRRRAQHNMELLKAAVPDAVDLMVICAESGLHIDNMLLRVGEDVVYWSPILAEELSYTHADIHMGTPRAEALSKLANRTRVSEIDHLVRALIQADQYGTPLVKALKDIARETRRLHLLSVEERMGRIPATISLPLMIFVLIPLVVLLAGPSLIMLIRSLKGI